MLHLFASLWAFAVLIAAPATALHCQSSHADLCIIPEFNFSGAYLVLGDCGETSEFTMHPTSTDDGENAVEGVMISYDNRGGECWDLPGGVSTNGGRPRLGRCYTDNVPQIFQMGTSFGAMYIWSLVQAGGTRGNGTTQCVEVTDGQYYPGAEIQLWECDRKRAQQSWNCY